mmetsp:Transcript_7306/g.29738  ORF Transcript_7306/g.29738 Transcript_7306/m.29738 type:complete len:382 (-) Transcript_7306:529-1674(-)
MASHTSASPSGHACARLVEVTSATSSSPAPLLSRMSLPTLRAAAAHTVAPSWPEPPRSSCRRLSPAFLLTPEVPAFAAAFLARAASAISAAMSPSSSLSSSPSPASSPASASASAFSPCVAEISTPHASNIATASAPTEVADGGASAAAATMRPAARLHTTSSAPARSSPSSALLASAVSSRTLRKAAITIAPCSLEAIFATWPLHALASALRCLGVARDTIHEQAAAPSLVCIMRSSTGPHSASTSSSIWPGRHTGRNSASHLCTNGLSTSPFSMHGHIASYVRRRISRRASAPLALASRRGSVGARSASASAAAAPTLSSAPNSVNSLPYSSSSMNLLRLADTRWYRWSTTPALHCWRSSIAVLRFSALSSAAVSLRSK